MKAPFPLKKGDTIGITAPARKITMEELSFAVRTFENWGLNVKFGKDLFSEDHQFSGTDEQRTESFRDLLYDKRIRAIISARGGYGSMRIVDHIDLSHLKKDPKWIIGYSDITVFHSHVLTNTGIPTIHGTMPINFHKNEEAVESLRKTLFGEPVEYFADPHPLNREGKAEGILCGGNLSLLYALQGSVSDIDTKGKILFIEDLDEYLYHIDRMMISLKRSGKLSGLAGLIAGGMSDMKDNTIPFGKNAYEIIKDAVKEFDYPVCFNFPAGHIDRNLAMVMGRACEIGIGAEVKFYQK